MGASRAARRAGYTPAVSPMASATTRAPTADQAEIVTGWEIRFGRIAAPA